MDTIRVIISQFNYLAEPGCRLGRVFRMPRLSCRVTHETFPDHLSENIGD